MAAAAFTALWHFVEASADVPSNSADFVAVPRRAARERAPPLPPFPSARRLQGSAVKVTFRAWVPNRLRQPKKPHPEVLYSSCF